MATITRLTTIMSLRSIWQTTVSNLRDILLALRPGQPDASSPPPPSSSLPPATTDAQTETHAGRTVEGSGQRSSRQRRALIAAATYTRRRRGQGHPLASRLQVAASAAAATNDKDGDAEPHAPPSQDLPDTSPTPPDAGAQDDQAAKQRNVDGEPRATTEIDNESVNQIQNEDNQASPADGSLSDPAVIDPGADQTPPNDQPSHSTPQEPVEEYLEESSYGDGESQAADQQEADEHTDDVLIPTERNEDAGDEDSSDENSNNEDDGDDEIIFVAKENSRLPLTAVLESLLFVSEEAVEPAKLAKVLESPVDEVVQGLQALADDYVASARGLRVQVYNGKYQLVTAPPASPFIEEFLSLEMSSRLSGPALETLAVVAYRQPATRAQVEAIRGVDCAGVLRTLVQRGLVEEVGRLDAVGRPILYGVTELFMQHFGLLDLDELPPLEEKDADLLYATATLAEQQDGVEPAQESAGHTPAREQNGVAAQTVDTAAGTAEEHKDEGAND